MAEECGVYPTNFFNQTVQLTPMAGAMYPDIDCSDMSVPLDMSLADIGGGGRD